MTMLIAILAAVSDPLAMPNSMNAIPVQEGVVQPQDMAVPVSESVRAATWDDLAVKPLQAVHVKVACILLAQVGDIGSCLPASKFAPDATMIDWLKAREEFDQTAPDSQSAELEMLRIVNLRFQSVLAPASPSEKSIFSIRFFEEIISPEDARPPFIPVQRLSMKNIKLAQQMDLSLLGKIYPSRALRNGIAARVTMSCDIQASMKLLCRDPGQIELFGAGEVIDPNMVMDFRLATYQFASTLRLEPNDVNGEQVAGKQLSFAIVWKIPS